ncbi:MAG: glycoside hydrolase family 43 protein [Gemmatimonadota bacterium]|nr:glycoside hydrolase family 43 protein [Gemmatimonadota bacterium]
MLRSPDRFKSRAYLAASFLLLASGLPRAMAQNAPPPDATAPPVVRTGLRLPDIQLHDPWIVADQSTRTYYLYTAASRRITGEGRTGTMYYTSKDLAMWEGPYIAFVAPVDSWADPGVNAWAPEVHAYRGKYYLFTTLHNPAKHLPTTDSTRPNTMRATMIAVADSPRGPFVLTKTDAPITPPGFMTLDGTLYVDPAGKPWMVYAHEWLQKVDGTMEAIPLNDNLSAATGTPMHLFKASDAPWLDAQMVPNAKENHYVTDGPELFRTKSGALLMLWASYMQNELGRNGYVQTIARSKSGELKGPWEQLDPVIGNDSGHGMLFRAFDGTLMLVLHQPFQNARGKIYEMEDAGDHLRVVKYREDLSGPPLPLLPGQAPR